ncbi:hypothetical protein RKE29_03930 [Streptomyces sp. B1866]|uniref:hypothetical protein n=1 Tax=Streptomyces sp. B1866 TaxID=3075431 RepID=UPI002891C91A|nr:hypothetical protein [Streptomyces sp. B1866]MDT3395802.1 hypothetical protein [Streptomyces sp. B1866]
MARIRTVKPEMFISETLASVSLTAERTFTGLLTQADDEGRHRDNAAVIAGALWPLRPEHTAVHVEDDLQQLADTGLICRYTAADGKRYLHLVNWHLHQKINRPSASRLPSCPHHGAPADTHGGLTEPSNTHRTQPPTGTTRPHQTKLPRFDAQAPTDFPCNSPYGEPAGHRADDEDSLSPHGGIREASPSGSRIVDPGSVLTGDASAPAPNPITPSPTAPDLVAEYVTACRNRPPQRHLARLGKEIKALLGEGIHPDHLRAGLERLRTKGLDPVVLPSVVNEAMNADRPGDPPPSATWHQAWTNPADIQDAYGGAL